MHRGRLGRGGVDRIAKEQANPQADVLVTLPPFIQKAAADRAALSASRRPRPADMNADGQQKDHHGEFVALVNELLLLVPNSAQLQDAAQDVSRHC